MRTAENGFSALAEIRREIPDVMIAELYPPRMSGFERLSVVRRRFPSIAAIAMSGSFVSDGVPPGVAADAFYEKGCHPGLLFRIVKAMTQRERLISRRRRSASAAIWVPPNGHDDRGEPYVMLTCMECFRTFPQTPCNGIGAIHDADCIYCFSALQYAIVGDRNVA